MGVFVCPAPSPCNRLFHKFEFTVKIIHLKLNSQSKKAYYFNDQAVQKIVDAFSGNLGSLADKTKAIVQAGKSYNNFCGITSGTEGHVKFIYETDAINKD